MNLYLDDVRPLPPGFDALARTASEAIKYLGTNQVVNLSLDHDLGACDDCMALAGVLSADDWLSASGGSSMPHCEHVGSGRTVVEFMIQTGCWPIHKPLVHSMNPVGAKVMREMIDRHFLGGDSIK